MSWLTSSVPTTYYLFRSIFNEWQHNRASDGWQQSDLRSKCRNSAVYLFVRRLGGPAGMHEMMMVLPPEPVEPVDFIAAFVKGTATTLSIKAGEDENAVPFAAVALF